MSISCISRQPIAYRNILWILLCSLSLLQGSDAMAADTTPPESVVLDLPEVTAAKSALGIIYAASDADSGLKHVELFFRKDGGGWQQYGGMFTKTPIVFDGLQAGGGLYEFYTIAEDFAGNRETPPASPDAFTRLIQEFSGERVYVDQTATGEQTGESWENAVHRISSGVELSKAFDVSEVWVAGGGYNEMVYTRGNLNLRGGFRGDETKAAERPGDEVETIITGKSPEGKEPLGRLVLISGDNVTVEGFSIQDGIAEAGAGVYILGSKNITIKNCKISNNKAGVFGGGLYAYESFLSIDDCLFVGNHTDRGGGAGIYSDSSHIVLRGCKISNNKAGGSGAEGYGGGLRDNESFLSIDDCLFVGNHAGGDGGGAYLRDSYGFSHTIENSRFIGNRGGAMGGGIFLDLSYRDEKAVIRSCMIQGNVANRGGGVMFYSGTVTLENSLVSGNSASGEGAGVYDSTYLTRIIYSTIAGNISQGENYGAIASNGLGRLIYPPVIITNSLLAYNNSSAIFSKVFTFAITSSLFYENPLGDYTDETYGSLTGGHQINTTLPGAWQNISGDPMFVMTGPDAIGGNWTEEPVYDAESNRTLLVDRNANYEENQLAETVIKTSGTISLDAYVVTNTSQTLTVVGDVTDFTASGSPYMVTDYHLRTGSAAIDKILDPVSGEDIAGAYRDFDGAVRPVDVAGVGYDGPGVGFDIGAYEYRNERQLMALLDSGETARSFDFGTVLLDAPPTTRTLRLFNNGTEPFTFSSVAIVGEATTAFSLPEPFDLSPLSPLGERTVTLLFDPATTGTHAGTLQVLADGATSPALEIALAGECNKSSDPPDKPGIPSRPGCRPVLHVRIAQPSTESSGGPITYTYAWRSSSSGEMVTHPNLSLLEDIVREDRDGVTFDDNETWTVRVTPYNQDGDAGAFFEGRFDIGPGGTVTFRGNWMVY